jgi:hypothetical protein
MIKDQHHHPTMPMMCSCLFGIGSDSWGLQHFKDQLDGMIFVGTPWMGYPFWAGLFGREV